VRKRDSSNSHTGTHITVRIINRIFDITILKVITDSLLQPSLHSFLQIPL